MRHRQTVRAHLEYAVDADVLQEKQVKPAMGYGQKIVIFFFCGMARLVGDYF